MFGAAWHPALAVYPNAIKMGECPVHWGFRPPYRALVALANAETPRWLTSQKTVPLYPHCLFAYGIHMGARACLALWRSTGSTCGTNGSYEGKGLPGASARAAIMARNCPTDRQRRVADCSYGRRSSESQNSRCGHLGNLRNLALRMRSPEQQPRQTLNELVLIAHTSLSILNKVQYRPWRC